MNTFNIENDPLYLKACTALDKVCDRIDGKSTVITFWIPETRLLGEIH